MGFLAIFILSLATSAQSVWADNFCEAVTPTAFSPIDSFDATKPATKLTIKLTTNCDKPDSLTCGKTTLGTTLTDTPVALCSSLTSIELADLVRKADRASTKCGGQVRALGPQIKEVDAILRREKLKNTSDASAVDRSDFTTSFLICKHNDEPPCVSGIKLVDGSGQPNADPGFRSKFEATEKKITGGTVIVPK